MTKPEKLHETDSNRPDASASKPKDSVEGQALFEETHPRLTLLESGQSPGEVLKVAREKKGLTLEEVSSRTKINIHQLRAIESGDRSKFPPDTFARAFIKSYCKLVSLEAAPILAAYELDQAGFGGMGASETTARPENISASMPTSSRRLSSLNFDRRGGNKRVSFFVALAAVALLVGFYLPEFMASSSSDEVTIPPEIASAVVPEQSQPEGQEVPLAPSVEIGEDGVVREQVAMPWLENGTNAPAANVDPELAAATSVFSSLKPQVDETKAGAGSVDEGSNTVSKTAESESELQSTGTISAAEETQNASKPLPPKEGLARLSFSFSKESWVTVRDASGKVLLSALNKAGNTEVVDGAAPFQLIIGNADSVALQLNGASVDLAPHVRSDNVARFVLK